jgi:general secretion pathway protein G
MRKDKVENMLKRVFAPKDAAWTFVETIIVIAIIVVLTGIVGFVAFRYVDTARRAAAGSQIEVFRLSLNAYYVDTGVFPTTDQGLTALWEKPTLAPVPDNWIGPYLEKKVPRDPWTHEYVYRAPGPSGLPFAVSCLGADGTEGGDGANADIVSWDGK